MKIAKLLFFLFVMLIYSGSFAQMRSGGKKMKKVVCPIEDEKDLNFSLGPRLGDPYGLSIKVYFPKRWGLELVAGRTFPGLYDEANESVFNETITLPYDNTEYLGHDVRGLYTGELRLVYHVDFMQYSGVDWYVALGGQVRYYNIHYVFQYVNNNPPSSNVASTDDPYLAIGPELALGIEYVIPYRPLSSFAEVGVFGDVFNGGLKSKFFGGLGIRFNL